MKSSEFETKLMCLLDPDEPVPVDMEDCHRVWFGGGNRRSGAGMESGTLVVESVSRITSQTQSRGMWTYKKGTTQWGGGGGCS